MSDLFKKGLFTFFFLVCVVGCAGPKQLGHSYGDATRSNQLAQTMYPNAGQSDMEPVGLDGQKVEQIIDAYRAEKGEVEDEKLLDDMGSN